MCRFMIYHGRAMFMSDLLTRSEQSLIRQSYQAREREEPLNGDGFGAGWYMPEIDEIPCVFTSTRPAWSDRNLFRLAEKIRSGCIFAHVRAATPGLMVSEANCHPFRYGRFLWMHNGAVSDFRRIKRRLRESLSDTTYDAIEGTTDSEHAFAVFLDRMLPRGEEYTVDDLTAAMVDTIDRLNGWTREAGANEPSRYNFAVTDGRHVVATRYASGSDGHPETLYVSSGERFENVEGHYRMLAADGQVEAVIVASEPLTEEREDWTLVPPNTMVVVSPDFEVRMQPLA